MADVCMFVGQTKEYPHKDAAGALQECLRDNRAESIIGEGPFGVMRIAWRETPQRQLAPKFVRRPLARPPFEPEFRERVSRII